VIWKKDSIRAAAELAGLDEGDYGQKLIETKLSPTEQMVLEFFALTERTGFDAGAFVTGPSALESFANRLEALLSGLSQFNDPKGVYAHCFCEID